MKKYLVGVTLLLTSLCLPTFALAQDNNQSNPPEIKADAGPNRQSYPGKSVAFEIADNALPDGVNVQEIVWNFGDGVRTTGDHVSHIYNTPGTYTVHLTINTDKGSAEGTTDVQVFKYVVTLVNDSSTPEEQVNLFQQQAAKNNILLLSVRAKGSAPEAVTEEDLTSQLLDARDAVAKSSLLITWTSGSVGANVLSKFAQHLKQTSDVTSASLDLDNKGVIMLSDTPFGVLAPIAQSAFDQMKPSYVLLTKPEALSLLLVPLNPEEAKNIIFTSPLSHVLLGAFSTRTVRDISVTNFVSFGINFLVNHGVPINNIILILMLPIIATILSFSRQVIGIKAFGIITPALTTLTFLVMGLEYGLIVFSVILLSGTFTRLVVRRLHLLYLPRMALVLTSASISILLLFGVGVLFGQVAILSFSIFPILILTILAEEFIGVQFSSGARSAFTITAWTLLLAIGCYYIVSWQLLRTLIISYPEIIILGIPINILLGRWAGLRLTEYFRFRKLLRYSQ